MKETERYSERNQNKSLNKHKKFRIAFCTKQVTNIEGIEKLSCICAHDDFHYAETSKHAQAEMPHGYETHSH